MPRTEWDSIVAGTGSKPATGEKGAQGSGPPAPAPGATPQADAPRGRLVAPTLVDDGFEDDEDLTIDDSRG